MSEKGGVASSFIWAIAFIVITGIIMAGLYYSGFLGGTKKEKIDINIKAPSAVVKIG